MQSGWNRWGGRHVEQIDDGLHIGQHDAALFGCECFGQIGHLVIRDMIRLDLLQRKIPGNDTGTSSRPSFSAALYLVWPVMVTLLSSITSGC